LSGKLEVLLLVVVVELLEFLKLQATCLALVLLDVVLFKTVPDQAILANEGCVALVTLVVQLSTMQFHVLLQFGLSRESASTNQAFKHGSLCIVCFLVLIQRSFGCKPPSAKFTTQPLGMEVCEHMLLQVVPRPAF
jgi:hypothetical protein